LALPVEKRGDPTLQRPRQRLRAAAPGRPTGRGDPIHLVFGGPVMFGSLLDAPPSPRTYTRIADRCIQAIAALGQEEKALRTRAG
jgi:hypothetical protein